MYQFDGLNSYADAYSTKNLNTNRFREFVVELAHFQDERENVQIIDA